MSVISKNKKWIAWSVILSFLFLMQVSSLPLGAENGNQPERISKSQKASEPGAIERTAPAAKAKKKSILPYILVGLGVVAVGAAVYFLVIKKPKFTLSVTLGEGIEGTPAAGSHTYKKGESVSYNYTLSGGFKDLQVQIDGSPAAASGTVTMDGDHSISATSAKVASIAVNSTPSGAMVYDNGVNTGKTTPTVLEYSQAGSHAIIVRKCGYQDSTNQVDARMGEQQTVNASLREGVLDEFDVNDLASCWKTVDLSQWAIAVGMLQGRTENNSLNTMLYNTPFEANQYTASSRLYLKSGEVSASLVGMFLSVENNLDNLTGYMFFYYPNGVSAIIRLDGYKPYHMAGTVNPISIGVGSGIHTGFNDWNLVKIVRSNNTYTFSINDVVQHTINVTEYDPRYVGVIFGSYFAAEANFDFIRLDMGTGSIPQNIPPVFRGGTPFTGNLFDLVNK